jgi:fatty-acyl-CoA synthase
MQDTGFGGWLAKRRQRGGDRVAVIDGDGRELTYRQLADRAERAAVALAARGIGPGDRVAFLGENSPAFLEVLFGTVMLGAVFVPVNTRLAAPEVVHILSDSGARLLVHDPALEATATTASAGRIDHRLAVGGTWEAAIATNEPLPILAPVAPSDAAIIMYTSGTTGRPKGAVLTHGNLTWNALNVIVDLDVVSTDVALMISPMFHAASLGMGVLPIILKGGTLVLEPKFDPGRALELIQRLRVSMISGVPTTFQLLADHPGWASTDLSSLTKLTCGGSGAPDRIIAAYEERGLSFSQGYGMTETSPGATILAAGMTRAKQGSVGIGHFFTDVRVVDEFRRPVPAGTVGEIEILGPNVMARYHDQPSATAAALGDDGWLRSGDLGYLDEDGYLFVSDRLKDMIISGGENIYPAEIENLMMDSDAITGVAVIAVPDDRWGEVPWAILTVRPGATFDEGAIVDHLTASLARFKLPKRFIVVDELPRTASGKIRKAMLRSEYGSA